MGHHPQHIRSPSQLSALSVWRLFPSRRAPQVLIDPQAASAERVRAWEAQLSRLQSTCGCDQGAAGLVVGLIGYALFLLLRSGGWGHLGRTELLLGLGVLAATTSGGKFLGLWLAHRRLHQLRQEIRSQWTPHDPPEPVSRYVGAQGPDTPPRSRPCCGNASERRAS